MAKKFRFPLEMENGVEVRSIEELKENFSLAKILIYLSNGKLLTWLRDRYIDDIANEVEKLDCSDPNLAKKISDIFNVAQTTADKYVNAVKDNNKKLLSFFLKYCVSSLIIKIHIINNYYNLRLWRKLWSKTLISIRFFLP